MKPVDIRPSVTGRSRSASPVALPHIRPACPASDFLSVRPSSHVDCISLRVSSSASSHFNIQRARYHGSFGEFALFSRFIRIIRFYCLITNCTCVLHFVFHVELNTLLKRGFRTREWRGACYYDGRCRVVSASRVKRRYGSNYRECAISLAYAEV